MTDATKTTPGIVASNFKQINKNTLIGSVDLEIASWKLRFKGCLYHTKNGKEWISFPAREFTDQNGMKKYVDIIEFSDRAVHERFQTAALAAVHAVVSRS